MPRSPLTSAVIVLLAFIAGLSLGFCLSAAPGTQTSSRASVTAAASDGEVTGFSDRQLQDVELRAHVAEVERQLVELKEAQATAILNDRLAFHKKYSLAPESFDDSLAVTPAMASFLKMSDAEKKAIEGHLAEIHAQVQALEKQHMKLITQTDNSVTYEIEPYPEGTTLKNQLHDLVEGDIGTDRADLFLDSARWENNSSFGGFGSGKVDIQVTQTDQSGPVDYKLKETFSDGSGIEQTIGKNLPARYAGLIQLDTTP